MNTVGNTRRSKILLRHAGKAISSHHASEGCAGQGTTANKQCQVAIDNAKNTPLPPFEGKVYDTLVQML